MSNPSSPKAIKSPILYQNPSKSITLLDIPASIALSQLAPGQSLENNILLSCLPLQEPYTSCEPKSEKARSRVISRQGPLHPYKDFICSGLDEIRKNYEGDWCLPRQISTIVQERCNKKRKLDEGDCTVNKSSEIQEPILSDLPLYRHSRENSKAEPALSLHVQSSLGKVICSDYLSLSNKLVLNTQANHLTLELTNPSPIHPTSPPASYRIPPNSAFYPAEINRRSARQFSKDISTSPAAYSSSSSLTSAGPGQFDIIILDPPWQNRSVKRSDQYLTKTGSDIMKSFDDILGKHISPQGLVACWITNKPSTREAALAAFKNWGVELIEEWVWVKVTVKGETVYSVDGLWRRPFEIALIGQKPSGGLENPSVVGRPPKEITKCLIVAVPDLHSRKPCLRSILEPMMQDPQHCCALELFARNLNRGWCSWGNEVLKFNWDGHWARDCNEKDLPRWQSAPSCST